MTDDEGRAQIALALAQNRFNKATDAVELRYGRARAMWIEQKALDAMEKLRVDLDRDDKSAQLYKELFIATIALNLAQGKL